MKKLALFLLLAGCATSPVTKIVTKPILVYPELPAVSEVPTPQLYSVHFILPTDAAGKVENITNCIANNTAGDAATKCTTGDTNVFVGLDQTDFVHLELNLQAIHNAQTECALRINQVNIERKSWTDSNAANNLPATPAEAMHAPSK